MTRVLLVLPSLLLVVAMVLIGSPTVSTDSSSSLGGTCRPSGYLKGKSPKTVKCADCCRTGEFYPQYRCSPPMTGKKMTRATMTLNIFSTNGDGGGPSACDDNFHSDDERVVALSTGWYSLGTPCLKNITINGNGKTVVAMVVDECDSVHGCDADHDFQLPCRNNIVGASLAVWKALGIPKPADIGEYQITWSDA